MGAHLGAADGGHPRPRRGWRDHHREHVGRHAGLRRDPSLRRLCGDARRRSRQYHGHRERAASRPPHFCWPAWRSASASRRASSTSGRRASSSSVPSAPPRSAGRSQIRKRSWRSRPPSSRASCSEGLWGFIPGFLKAATGAHEVVTTIMLNFIAAHDHRRAGGRTAARTRRRLRDGRSAQRRVARDLRPRTCTSGCSLPSPSCPSSIGCSEDDQRLRDPDRRRQPDGRTICRHAARAS